MGRFGSIADMFQGMVQIGFTLILGFFAECFSLQIVCLVFSLAGAIIAFILLATVLIPSKARYFVEDTKTVSC